MHTVLIDLKRGRVTDALFIAALTTFFSQSNDRSPFAAYSHYTANSMLSAHNDVHVDLFD